MNTDIIGKAMLVRLSISIFNPSKTDKSATAEVLLNKNASKGSAEVRKMILPKEAIDPINKLSREIRQDYYRMTLPWDEEGARLLPTAMWLEFVEMMATYRDKWDKLVNGFIDDYQQHRQNAIQRLGLLFDSRDYPDVGTVREKFGLRTHWNPLPKSDDFRLTLGAGDMEEIQCDLDRRVQSAVVAANKDLYNRLAERLTNVSKRLSDPENIFRDSLIEGLRDLCSLLPGLNVSEDQELEALRKQVVQDIASADPQQIRDDDDLRVKTKSAADEILRKMGIAIAPVVESEAPGELVR